VDGVDATMAMERHVAADPTCIARYVAIRISLHHGDCPVEDDADVFDDAVNIASRMA